MPCRMETILSEIRMFCKAHGVSETTFGAMALNDRPLVAQLKNGRELRSATLGKVRAFMADYVAPDNAA